jgi:hypothetical protein
MASHNRTPRSVLHAPKVEVIPLVSTKGPNRQTRRQGGDVLVVTPDGEKRQGIYRPKYPSLYRRISLAKPARIRYSFAESRPTDNEPYVKPRG